MLQTSYCNAGNYPSPKEEDWIARDFRLTTTATRCSRSTGY